jgi:hypothetical protein
MMAIAQVTAEAATGPQARLCAAEVTVGSRRLLDASLHASVERRRSTMMPRGMVFDLEAQPAGRANLDATNLISTA